MTTEPRPDEDRRSTAGIPHGVGYGNRTTKRFDYGVDHVGDPHRPFEVHLPDDFQKAEG